jgi:preprotein translocase subunit SecG
MEIFISYSVIAVAILLVATILIQVRGGGIGLFGGFDTSFRTRRGVEKTLFQFTIGLAVVFVILALANIRVA